MLEAIEVDTAPKPRGAIIWLHGLGADGHDFEPIVPGAGAARRSAPGVSFSRTRRCVPVTINNGMRMRAWYDIQGFDRGRRRMSRDFGQADAMVRELIEREVARGIPPGRIVLAGFSQGGAVSLYAAPRFRKDWPGSWPCRVICRARAAFAAERRRERRHAHIHAAHGQADPVVPLARASHARDFLKARV